MFVNLSICCQVFNSQKKLGFKILDNVEQFALKLLLLLLDHRLFLLYMLYIIRVLYKSRIYIYNSWYAIYIYNSWQIPQNAIYMYNSWQIPPERNLYI